MDIIKFFKQPDNLGTQYEHHPAGSLEQEDKIRYLQGLALLCIVDGKITTDEKEYLAGLVETFDLPNSMLDDFLAYANNPDQEIIPHIIESIKTNKMEKIFLIDCLILAQEDSKIEQQEKDLIDQFFELFGIESRIKDQIYYAHNLIKDQEDRWQLDSLEALFTALEM